MFKDTLELLDAHPSFFGAYGPGACGAYTNKAAALPSKITFVFSQPRCGSTLLLRLMNSACLSLMIGDHDKEFYQSILTTYKEMKAGVQHGPPTILEERFCDEYRGTSMSRDMFCMRLAARMMLFRSHNAGYAKSCIIGFVDDDLAEFADMLRDLFENDELTLIFLTRDHDEIIESMKAKTRIDEGIFRTCLHNQREQFKEARDLDDTWIDYNDIVSDPIGVLRKMNPLYPPNHEAVKRIMNNKLR